MKKIAVTSVALIGVVAALPYAIGIMAEKKFMSFVDNINRQTNSQVTVLDYKRGWLNSVADVKIQPKRIAQRDVSAPAIPSDDYLLLHERVIHGPIMMTGNDVKFGIAYFDSQFKFDPTTQEKFDKAFANQTQKPKLNFVKVIHFDGSADITLNSPEFSFKDDDTALTFKGLDAQWNINSNFSRVDGHFNFAGIAATGPRYNLQLDPTTITWNQSQASNGLWTGDAKMSLPKFNYSEQGIEKLNLQDFALQTENKLNSDLYDSSLGLALNKIDVSGEHFGPGKLDVSLINIDANALVAISNKAQSMGNSSGAGLNPRQQQMMLFTLLPYLPQLISKGAEFHLSQLKFATPQGVLDASGKVVVAKPVNASQAQEINAENFKQRVDAGFTVQMPKALMQRMLTSYSVYSLQRHQAAQAALAQQAAMQPTPSQVVVAPVSLSPEQIAQQAQENATKQIETWLASGMLIAEGDLYRVDFAYKQGQLTINGKQP